MRLKPWIWPAVASFVALAAVVMGLLVVDRLGERAIAHQAGRHGRRGARLFSCFRA
jgi:hypothetical protein